MNFNAFLRPAISDVSSSQDLEPARASCLSAQFLKNESRENPASWRSLFIGKLGDALADDMAGNAETNTLHGFARRLVLEKYGKGWHYYPDMKAIIDEDLATKGIKEEVGGEKYLERANHYKGVGNADVVWHAVRLCRDDPANIPKYDLILVDEFQDFNEIEAAFIDLLATQNKMLVVGDDDQALYEFKGSSPKYIRDRHHPSNPDWESHTLQFCGRCTDVVIKAFHAIVTHFKLNELNPDRIKKEYVCFFSETESGGKQRDSELNPKICVMRNVKPGAIASFVRGRLSKMLRNQKVRTALVIGEARSCQGLLEDTARKLKEMGFRYVDHRTVAPKIFDFNEHLISGYKILASEDNDPLAWRLISKLLSAKERTTLIQTHYTNATGFISNLPSDFRKVHSKNAGTLRKLIESTPSERKQIADSTINTLKSEVVVKSHTERQIFVDQVVAEQSNLPRPLNSIEITVTNILGAKGLGADVVFLVGFDQGKFPSKPNVETSEIYQMLVALTRAKKRIYLMNTIGVEISQFMSGIPADLVEVR